MIRSLVRSFFAVLAALSVALVLIIAVEILSAIVHPFPPGFDQNDMGAMKTHVANYPQWILAAVVPIWGGITFLSTWMATRLGTNRHPVHGLIVGLLLLAAVEFNMSMLPYPDWFEVANPIVFILAIIAGIELSRSSRAARGSHQARSR